MQKTTGKFLKRPPYSFRYPGSQLKQSYGVYENELPRVISFLTQAFTRLLDNGKVGQNVTRS